MSNDYAMNSRTLSSETEIPLYKLLTRCSNNIKRNGLEHLVFVIDSLKELLSNIDNVKTEKRSALLGDNLEYKDGIIYWTEDLRKKQEEVDVTHVIIRDVIAHSMKNSSPALKKGLASIIANNLIGNDYDDLRTFDEQVAIGLLFECYGFDNIFGYIVNGKINIDNNEKKHFEDIIALMEQNYEYRKRTKTSNLTHIQFLIIDRFVKKNDLDKEKIKNFKLNLATNGEMFAHDGVKYKGLEDSEKHFDILIKKMELNNRTK